MRNKQKSILIIGGGAAGMMAAIVAARKGARVTVLERMQRVGKKILATGNGRCNYTNKNLEIGRYHGANPRFAQDALQQFGAAQTLAFFEQLGIAPRVEEGGKVFPASGQAASVLDVLRYEMERLGVAVVCEANIEKIVRDKGGLQCVSSDGGTFAGDCVIVTTGGKSNPALGSNGGGFKIAEALGHRIVPTYPALVQVRLQAPFLKQLQGIKVEGGAAVWVDGQEQRAERGEIHFADYGVSGIPVLQLSRIVSEFTAKDQAVSISIRLFPDQSEDELFQMLTRRIAHDPGKPTDFSFVGLLHKRLIPVLLKEAGNTDLQRACGELSQKEIRRIAAVLDDWRVPAAGTQSWTYSQVTAGGVDVTQVDSRSLESKQAPGVYFAGEVLDIDGDSGGFNLQWAWASGTMAGEHAAS